MGTTEVLLADIGKAADELGLGIESIETDEIRFFVSRGKRGAIVTVRAEGYGPVTGDMLRAIITPKETPDAG